MSTFIHKRLKMKIQAHNRVQANSQWKAKIVKAFSTVRRPKIEEETDQSLTMVVQEFSLYPSIAKLMQHENLVMNVTHDSGSLIKVQIKQMEQL